MLEVLHREFIYVWYYFTVQLEQIFRYWVLGMVIGSVVSVFFKDTIHGAFAGLKDKKWGVWGVIPASLLGVASPLCMYGTIPIAASFSRSGMRQDWLAAFMMSSVLLNPQLILYSTALGPTALAIRILSCTICGIVAGIPIPTSFSGSSSTWAGTSRPRVSTSSWVCCSPPCSSGMCRQRTLPPSSARPTRALGC